MKLAVILISGLAVSALGQKPVLHTRNIQPAVQAQAQPEILMPKDSGVAGQIAALKAELVNKDAQIASLKMYVVKAEAEKQQQILQQQWTNDSVVFSDWVVQVKKANGWGADVSYNADTKQFIRNKAK